MRAVNVDGVRSIAEAALAAGVRRLVHCSSVHAFDLYREGTSGVEVDERWPRVPDEPSHFAYDRSKAAGERALREVMGRGLDAVIVHPSGVIGPYDFGPSRMGRMFLQLYRRSLPSLIDGAFDFVDVRDVVAGMLAAQARGENGENYLLTGHTVHVRDIGAIAEAITGVKPPRLVAPIWFARIGVPLFGVAGAVMRQEPLYTHESLSVLATRALRPRQGRARARLHGPAVRRQRARHLRVVRRRGDARQEAPGEQRDADLSRCPAGHGLQDR
ncbi:NAD-dependent epimerase/dehydratase family protein [Nannocystis pusilla]|uniref:NAD-dependent epimerase/dehydratase family protein n=1 Tax=Nannocystis pusilla TaxID=889268 RepID=UPI003B776497